MNRLSSEVVIQATGLTKSYGTNEVLRGVDLTVHQGEVVSILGRSGGGKSTLLRCLNLLESPDQGRIEVAGDVVFSDGRAASGTKLVALRKRVGMVFQSFHLFPHLTAVENVTYPLVKVRGKGEDQAIAEALDLLDRVGMLARCKDRATQLSGGQQQRVAIARALALKPEALLFDEPTSALDPESTVDVLAIMKELSQDGMTMAVVTHELSFAMKASDRIIFMDKGNVVEDDAPDVVRSSSNPTTASFFRTHLEGEK